ncbi:MAG: hypothetical protein ACRDBM_13580 [Sporomusa sp.]
MVSENDNKAIIDAVTAKINKQLTTPDSATFCSADEFEIEETPEGYTVKGFVRSRNGLGELLRSNFTCQVKEVNGKLEAKVSDITLAPPEQRKNSPLMWVVAIAIVVIIFIIYSVA